MLMYSYQQSKFFKWVANYFYNANVTETLEEEKKSMQAVTIRTFNKPHENMNKCQTLAIFRFSVFFSRFFES